ncbi:hypothetical protein ACV3V0_10580 [Clostridium perfringens]
MSKHSSGKNTETYKFKYIVEINTNQIEILSNLSEQLFISVINELKLINNLFKNIKVIDCIEFEYGSICNGVRLEQLF